MELSYPLTRVARSHPNREAVCDVRRKVRLSYGQLEARVNRLANALIGLGIEPGDRVAQLQLNSHQVVEVLFAVARVGAVKVPINARLSAKDIQFILADSGAKLLVCDAEFTEVALHCLDELDDLRTVISTGSAGTSVLGYEDLLAAGSTAHPGVEVTGTMLGRLAYTGGTTGRPKGVMATHDQLFAVATNVLLDHAQIEATDSLLHVQPLSHGGGTYIVPAVLRGARQVILPRFDADEVLQTCKEEHITFLKVVPTMYVRLLSNKQFVPALASVRLIGYGAAPMPTNQLIEGVEKLGPRFTQTYGQTEAPATICTLRHLDIARAVEQGDQTCLSSIGRPYSTMEVRIVDDADNEVAPGELGEITVRGAIVMSGYWHNDEATADRLRGGWVHTGDIGRMDDQGFIYLVDRKGDMIISGGFNVYPREVEEALYSHPAVREAAVVGIPDTEWGEIVTAVVAVRPGQSVSSDDLMAHARSLLSSYKRPRRIEVWDSIPTSAVGKIVRREVRDSLMAVEA